MDAFVSHVPFSSKRVQAAAVYCSDGRFGEQIDDFLENGLGLPRYDRLAVPGGAACLASHFDTYREEEAALAHLKFLVDVHGLRRVVLIAHQDCAFYLERLKTSPLQLGIQQRDDLQKAIARVHRLAHHLMVETYLARQEGQNICFEPV